MNRNFAVIILGGTGQAGGVAVAELLEPVRGKKGKVDSWSVACLAFPIRPHTPNSKRHQPVGCSVTPQHPGNALIWNQKLTGGRKC